MQDTTYGEYQEEMNMLNKALLEVLSEGDANGRVFTFPIPTVNITKDFNWDNPVIESLWEASAKYGIPYFSNFINSDMDPEDARSMCCRLRIDNRQLEYRGGGLFGSNPMTGSVGVVTINLPRLALKSKNEKEFFKGLAELMDMAKDSLETKRKVLERLTDANLYPYTKFYLRNIKQRFNQYWKNHFSTIGLIGTNEAALNLLGVDIGTEKVRLLLRRRLILCAIVWWNIRRKLAIITILKQRQLKARRIDWRSLIKPASQIERILLMELVRTLNVRSIPTLATCQLITRTICLN